MARRSKTGLPVTGLVLAAVAMLAPPAWAQSGDNVLVVVNASSAVSERLGEYYAEVRDVPPSQILRISVDPSETISRAEYDRTIEAPIRKWISAHGAHDRILYIVLTSGVPLRITGQGGRQGTAGSVDSELTLVYRRLTGEPVAPSGRVVNPLFQGDAPIGDLQTFSHEVYDIYLVTRLDGFSEADATGLIDRGRAEAGDGPIVLDLRGDPEQVANRWLRTAAERVAEQRGESGVILERSEAVADPATPALGYYSWGSNDPALAGVRTPPVTFAPGAIAGWFVSTDARTFSPPPEDWVGGAWERPEKYYAGSPQSLTGDLVAGGVSGAVGYVAEPYLDGTVRPDVLFPAYLAGATLAEAAYLALPDLSWQAVVIGDPLLAPFPRQPVSADLLDPPVDPRTGLPRYFAERRLARRQIEMPGVAPEVVWRLVRAETAIARDDVAAARTALEEALAIDPRAAAVALALAGLDERESRTDAAIARYRDLLEWAPSNVGAMNNLAFLLAEQGGDLDEALVLAERASAVAGGDPSIADTLGWILHLTGDTRRARGLLERAATQLVDQPEVLHHLAEVRAAADDRAGAREAIERALAIDPTLADRPDVQALRDRVAEQEPPAAAPDQPAPPE